MVVNQFLPYSIFFIIHLDLLTLTHSLRQQYKTWGILHETVSDSHVNIHYVLSGSGRNMRIGDSVVNLLTEQNVQNNTKHQNMGYTGPVIASRHSLRFTRFALILKALLCALIIRSKRINWRQHCEVINRTKRTHDSFLCKLYLIASNKEQLTITKPNC